MSRDRRRLEQAASSYREPGYGRSYRDEYSRRQYASHTELLPGRSFNYWWDETVVPTSYYPQRSYGQGSHNERWLDDSRPRYAESSYSGPRHNSGPAHNWDGREPRRDRHPPFLNPPRQRYSTYTPPYIPRPTFRPRSDTEYIPPSPKPVLPDPPRKTSSPPNKSSQPPRPNARYLSCSQEPSEVLQDPGTSRKLLVLDLNGTLLIRSARSRTSSRQLRPVQPRPYMQSFRQYLFCLETKAWLDTMVWSSAQPHSVDNMVDKVFGSTKDELKAIWNRKNLGLSEAEYHRDVVTTKDLTKPWSVLAPALGSEKSEGRSALSSQSRAIHSAFTSILLDDSPQKAVLQPYNHISIPEYDSTRRRDDLQSLLTTRGPKQNKKAKRKNQVEAVDHSADQVVPGPSGDLSECAEKEPYDATLLAVIGILDAVKLQSNVAGWIRKGGLSATQERRGEVGALDIKHHSVFEAERGKTGSSRVVPTGNDVNEMWFNDSPVVAYWVARGRRALMELGIQVVHGVTG